MLKNLGVLLTLLILSTSAQAALSPVAIDIFAPVQFPPSDFSVTGVRVTALLGHQRNMYGIDIAGVANMTDLEFTGAAVAAGLNITHGNTNVFPFQIAGLSNINTQKIHLIGVQISAINSNVAEGTIYGFEIGPIANLASHTTVNGFQIGLFNQAYEINGFQIGLLNFTTSLHGLQIGLLNFNEKGLFSVCPVLNFGF